MSADTRTTRERHLRSDSRRYLAEKSSVILGRWHVYDFYAGEVARDGDGQPAYFDVRADARSFAASQEVAAPWPTEVFRITAERRFWAQVDRSGDGCWEWQGRRTPTWGYGRFVFGDDQLAHRVAWIFGKGAIPDGLGVLHHCDNPPCVNYERCLFLGTRAENNADRDAKGRGVAPRLFGERNGQAKVTEATVREIRVLHAEGATQARLACDYGLSPAAVSMTPGEHAYRARILADSAAVLAEEWREFRAARAAARMRKAS